MKRILFVDDEPQVLAGLRNLLRRQRSAWEMVFALGGRAALEELEKGRFDVVVSDMRMPDIDGAELLGRVKDQFGAVTRIVLSGHAERSAVMRALPVAHQFLSKPCDANRLKDTVARACELQRLVSDETLRGVIGRLARLPSLPDTFWELSRAVQDPAVTPDALAEIVKKDPAMSAKVLQLVNSAFFGLPQSMTSVSEAVLYLGSELLRGLAVASHVFDAAAASQPDGFSVERWQADSVKVAQGAARSVTDPADAETAFTAGLLHDVGQLVLAMGLPKETARVAGLQRTGSTLDASERAVFGVTHADVGAYLLGIWGLPLPVVHAAAYHHAPDSAPADSKVVVAAVHTADL